MLLKKWIIKIKDDQFVLITDYGEFSYPFEKKEDTIILAGIEYKKEK